MGNRIKEVFGTEKPIIGMLHLKGETDSEIISLADKEIKILLENHADCVLVENYFGTPDQAEMVLEYVSKTYPDICYGINLLHNDQLGFELAKKYRAKFIQLDSVSGHLAPDEDEKFQEFITKARKECDAFVLGGVRFKYQPYKSGRRLDEDLAVGMKRCDAIVVTGDATGRETDLEKIRIFRDIIGDFPLFVGAGLTPRSVEEQLSIADGAIVGSYFKDTYKDTGDICAGHVREFMDEVICLRESMRNITEVRDREKPKQYTIYKEGMYEREEEIARMCEENGLEGTEIFMDDVVSRDRMLYADELGKKSLIEKLESLGVKRLHCSYWAYPTSFLTKNRYRELVERFGTVEDVKKYYGDLTGQHMYERWVQEYEIASAMHAQAYTFHLIDYAPIDGKWEFTISRDQICQAMVYMIQNLLNLLLERGIMTEDSPVIEVENAGWGLEYGLQTAEDFEEMFSQLYDPYDKVRIGWDINHLLHAVGFSEKDQRAEFFLTYEEMTEEMRGLEDRFGRIPQIFVEKWLDKNILARGVLKKTGSLHLSDCCLKRTAYFKNGKLIGKYNDEMQSLTEWDDMENYGVGIVLGEYDSHEILSEGILSGVIIRRILGKLQDAGVPAVVLHELKNSKDQKRALGKQLNELWAAKGGDLR